MEDILDPNEQIIWSGKPNKKAFMLPAFGGIPFAIFFSVFLFFMITLGNPSGFEWLFPIFVLIWIIGLIVIPPIWQYRKIPHAEYMITNQRLIIKSGITENDVWFAELDKIKDAIVKIGLADKIVGTGKIYPITSAYPYEPKTPYRFTEGGMNSLTKVYNIAEQKHEEITEMELYRKVQTRPKLEALTEPYAVAKLLKEAIFGAGTNFVNCKYCYYRYDLNKEGKCPRCGGTQKHDYSTIF